MSVRLSIVLATCAVAFSAQEATAQNPPGEGPALGTNRT